MPDSSFQALRGERARNWPLRGLAVFLAVVVWYAIRAAISHDTLVTDVPVEIHHDEGWAVLERSDETADIRFRGSRADVRDLIREHVRVVIDGRGQSQAGQKTVRIDPSSVRAPSGVRAISVRPETVTFSLDREGERQVPVRADLQGSLPDGYEVSQWSSTPASVLLRGPMTRVETVETIRTAPIELDGREQSFRVRRSLVPPPQLAAAKFDPDRVQVDVTILEEYTSSRVLEDVPLSLLTQPGGPAPVWIEPDRVTVTLQGRADVLRRLDASRVLAFVDASPLAESDEVELPVVIPPIEGGVRLVSVSPSFARVRTGPAPSQEEESP